MVFESTSKAEQGQAEPESGGTRWALLLALAVFASLGFLIVYSRYEGSIEQMGSAHPGVGTKLSSVQFEPFVAADRTVTLADLPGHVTLINYWGPWCPPCRMEMPHIAEIEKKYRSQSPFQLISVACGAWVYTSLEEMRAETAEYHDQEQLEFPVYFDPEFISRAALESDLGLESQAIAYPTTVLVDQQGKIAGMWQGYSPDVPREITVLIDRLLAAP